MKNIKTRLTILNTFLKNFQKDYNGLMMKFINQKLNIMNQNKLEKIEKCIQPITQNQNGIGMKYEEDGLANSL